MSAYEPLRAQGTSGAEAAAPSKPSKGCGVCCTVCAVISLCLTALCVYFLITDKLMYVPPAPRSLSLLPYMNGRTNLNWWNLPKQRSEEQLNNCTSQLKDLFPLGGLNFGSIAGKDAPMLAYECTWVDGLSDLVPEPLQGVFWMKGNAMTSELAVLQFSQWFEDVRTLAVPVSPFNWGWGGADGAPPANAPMNGKYYKDHILVEYSLELAHLLFSFTYSFEECPWALPLPWPLGIPGHECVSGSGLPPDFNFSYIETHGYGDVTELKDSVIYTLEDMPKDPANLWWRGIYGPVPGLPGMSIVSIGSYQLTRIIDGKGRPVEPYYSDFKDYIGDTNLTFWYNYSYPEVETLYREDKFEEANSLGWKMYCADHDGDGLCSH